MTSATTSNWVPSACTLPTVEQPLRAQEFDALFAENLVSVEELAVTKARLALSGPRNLVELVQDLADRESRCCSFFAFEVSAGQANTSQAGRGEVAVNLDVDVEVPTAYTDVLAALVTQARAQSSTPARDSAAGCGCCATPA